MRNTFKKLLCSALCACIVVSSSTSAFSAVKAVRNNDGFVVNSEWEYFMDVYNINGSNYYKLRDIVCILNGWQNYMSLEYKASENSIYIDTNGYYDEVGSELAATGTNAYADAVVSSANVYVDGKKINCSAYNINGNTYFKLRDLADALNFSVNYDPQQNLVFMDINSGSFSMTDFINSNNADFFDNFYISENEYFYFSDFDDSEDIAEVKKTPAQFDTSTKGGDIKTLLNSVSLNPKKTIYNDLNKDIDKFMAEHFTSGMDTYTKAVVTYDYLINNISYNSPMYDYNGNDDIFGTVEYNALSLLETKEGVCDNYSAAFAVIMRAVGVDMKVTTGKTHMANGGYGGHAWVTLRINGLDYVFDPQVEQDIRDSTGGKTYYRFGKAYSAVSDKYVPEYYYEFQN